MKSNTFNLYQQHLAHIIMSAALFLGIFTSCQDEDFGFTAEEISYETKFFKEFGHPDPNHNWGFKTMEVIDNTSTDTRAAGPNANEWGSKGLDVPTPLTPIQKEKVTEWFTEHHNPQGITVSWTDYFAQQVSSTSYGSHMDYLLDAGNNYQDHINNFNSGNCSETNVNNQYKDRIQYMTGQSTKAFGYHESVGQNTYFDHYVIIPGTTIDPSNQYGLHGMFFVGFDYEAYKSWAPNEDRVERDYYFNDWIIRISPGTCSSISQRVMCEDLGNSFDWDFNDVVFDVSFQTTETWWPIYKKATYAKITLQAAGGELPIIVGTNDSNYEVHKLLGDGTSTPLVRPNKVAIYTVEINKESGFWSWIGNLISNDQYDASMIPIYVNGNNINNLAQQLQRAAVPQKFACPTSVDWSPELTNIAETYPNFTQWVQDAGAQGIWDYNPKQQQNAVIEQ